MSSSAVVAIYQNARRFVRPSPCQLPVNIVFFTVRAPFVETSIVITKRQNDFGRGGGGNFKQRLPVPDNEPYNSNNHMMLPPRTICQVSKLPYRNFTCMRLQKALRRSYEIVNLVTAMPSVQECV